MRRPLHLFCVAVLYLACLFQAHAQAGAPAVAQDDEPALAVPAPVFDQDGVLELETMVVTGSQPGPGMWKVSNGDNVLWVMGTLSPLPARMQWLSRDVVEVVARSQEVIEPPGVTVKSGIGRVRGLMLVPSLFRARKNPEGERLQDVLDPELYARWNVLKARYLGRSNKTEDWRPIFAARELYQAGVKRSGLSEDNVVAPVVRATAKRYQVKTTSPLVTIALEEPKQAIREFSASPLGDIKCFETTLARLETDLAAMVTRANAWAIGDVEALRALPYQDQNRTCIDTLLQSGLARSRGIDDLPLQVRTAWLDAAESGLRNNAETFAMLPVSELIKPDGYLAQLEARGYQVEAP